MICNTQVGTDRRRRRTGKDSNDKERQRQRGAQRSNKSVDCGSGGFGLCVRDLAVCAAKEQTTSFWGRGSAKGYSVRVNEEIDRQHAVSTMYSTCEKRWRAKISRLPPFANQLSVFSSLAKLGAV